MQRITEAILENEAEVVNQMSGNVLGVSIGHAYGMVQLYLVNKKTRSQLRQLTSGSKREVYEYLSGMTSALHYLNKSDPNE